MERIAMSQEERDYLDWLRRAKDGSITQREAAQKMKISDRWVRTLLKRYLDERILYYTTRDLDEVREIDARTAKLQGELWSGVRAPARANPTPLTAVVVWGMNDVLNAQGYTQAAWWNRIPTAAWLLMVMIAVCCNVLVGYRAHNFRQEAVVLLVLPLVVSISFFLIADIDSPRGGLIRVSPQNLAALAGSLRAP